MKRLFCGLIALIVIQSCEFEELPYSQEDSGVECAEVSFRFDAGHYTKGVIHPNDRQIRNVNVYAYDNGVLVDQVYGTLLKDLVLKLPVGRTYNIYALANMGRCDADVLEEEFVQTLQYKVVNIVGLTFSLPMSAVNQNVYINGTSKVVDLKMERLAAKINLSIDKGALLNGLAVNSVKLCQCASVVWPFKWRGKGGSRVGDSDAVISGDYASAADLAALNSGEGVSFYTLENCQGILLPDNDDPSQKLPQMIPEKEDLCTYLEIGCQFGESGLFDGDVVYRIYLGLDDCTSFDVPGNACINVMLTLTDDGLKQVSWKVQSDVRVRDGYVSGCISEGMHEMNDLYVGEELLYDVVLADELVEYLPAGLEGCSLRFMKDGELVEGLACTPIEFDGEVWKVEMLCDAAAEGELYLYSPDGECVGCVCDDVRIGLPDMVLAEYDAWGDEPVEPLSIIPECEVNGEEGKVYLYFVDDKGYNLNGARSYGFNADLFDFESEGAYSGGDPVRSISAGFIQMPKIKGNSSLCVNFTCENDGRNHEENLLLAEIYGAVKDARLYFYEGNYSLSSSFRFGLGIPPVVLTLVDNGWAGYFDCQLSMKVDNPSNLPLDVAVCQMLSTNSAPGPVDSDYVKENLRIDQMDYMTGDFYNGGPPMYCSYSTFVSERNEEGDQALMEGDVMIYPLADISTEDIIKAANYNRRGTGQMMHIVEASVSGCRIAQQDLLLEDQVSDGSTQYDYIYYSSDSWNYRGAGLSSADRVYSLPEKWGYDYPNMTPCRIVRMAGRWDAGKSIGVYMLYNPDEGRTAMSTSSTNGAQYGLTLSLKYTGAVNGYVQTYPDGTWRKPQDNDCSVTISHTKTGVPLVETSQFVWADDGGLKSAMDGIYGHSYLDSDKPLGSETYMHRAHPTDMNLEMNLCVEGEKGGELYPYHITWDEYSLNYYHAQDGVTYKCALSSVTKTYNISIVRRR